jgi:hypothetical protein
MVRNIEDMSLASGHEMTGDRHRKVGGWADGLGCRVIGECGGLPLVSE